MSTLINFDGQTVFKVGVSESVTVPETRTIDSPTNDSNFDSIRGVAGGQLLAAYDDVAGSAVQHDNVISQQRLYPGDVVACSAVGVPTAGDVTVTITHRDGQEDEYILEGVTADAGVVGIYG